MASQKKSQIIENIKIKKKQKPLVCLTAYSYPIAKIIDQYCDIILVGDSLGMAIYGMKDTLSVTCDMMINHGKAVSKAAQKSTVIVDLPYGSYENSKEQAYKTALKIMEETKCDGVKLECSENIIEIVEFLINKNIPVMGHIGLLPQHIKEIGGYKYQGRNDQEVKNITNIALELEKAGVFSIVIEGVVEDLAKNITQKLSIPTIGIGASQHCDGQILVIDDLLGLNQEFKPKFVKNYTNLAQNIEEAVKQYSQEVENKKFPEREHLFFDTYANPRTSSYKR